ncbi:22406_t:CDS:2 [Dentiscutata erythropus]|uniref:22406_t:CDS:1 n=1 Tax=Dentiscutata erythropus TaxID=1348616 RepID=A0A9N9EUU6_9GLOM|nr:22406_t:CDS:2 [Dentiscutata erythropus]
MEGNEDNDAILAKKLQEEEENNFIKEVNSLALARQLQAEKDLESNENPEDLYPDIHGLFIAFDQQYFWGCLKSVEVKWSTKMTLVWCAGLCYYQAGGYCSIRLSEPLLKFRTRQDMIETLLHEMIHAYLFVTNNNKDHNAHGPEFLKHMERINAVAGTKISVYHKFHNEGPCQYKAPYFGIVQRAMNRPPQPADNWWGKHKQSCGGNYHKIAEPQKEEKNQVTKKVRKRKIENDKASGSNSLLDKWFQWFRKDADKEKSQGPKFKRRFTDVDSGHEHNQLTDLKDDSINNSSSTSHATKIVQCPICGNRTINNSVINDHIDLCIWASENGEQLQLPIT